MKSSGDSNFSVYRSSDFIIPKKFSIRELVVQTVSLSRHTLNYMMLFKPFPISEVLVLPTLIRMKYESVKVITLIKCFIEHVIYLFKMKCTLLHFIFLGIFPNNLMSALTIEPVRCLQRTSP